MNVTKYVNDWLEKGGDDLSSAEVLLKERVSPNPVCFHAQQAAEKYLKGFLAHHEKHVRKVHDLDVLLDPCVQTDPSFEELKAEVAFLNQFYVETRYPGDFPQFTFSDARKALESAKKIKEFVLEKINIKQ